MAMAAKSWPRGRAELTRRRQPTISQRASGDDSMYRMEHNGIKLAKEWRAELERELGKGIAAVDLARCAVLIAAEDDALVDVAGMPLPVEQWLGRLDRMADEISHAHLPTEGRPLPPEEAEERISNYLHEVQGFALPSCEDFPEGLDEGVLHHPGAWANPDMAYLTSGLANKRLSPPVMAILKASLARRLSLRHNALRYGLSLRRLPSSPFEPPELEPVPGAATVNALNSFALEACLRQLKRAFWPFAWNASVDGSAGAVGAEANGGFRPAAEALVQGGDLHGGLEKIAEARAARNRLDRGIPGATGAGDMVRCLAACERLCLMCGEGKPEEYRDLGVLLAHAGRPREGAQCLGRYIRSEVADEGQISVARLAMEQAEELASMPHPEIAPTDFGSPSAGRIPGADGPSEVNIPW